MNVVFMGTPEYCIPTLEELLEHYFLSAIITQPDKAANRGQKIINTPVKRFALKNNIPVFQPKKIKKDKNIVEELKKLSPDIIVVIAYGQIIPREILDIPCFGCINIHGSILPEYRGASPIQNALKDGARKTGVTSILMNEKMDEGDILKIIECPIHKDDNAGILHDRLSQMSARCTIETIEGLKDKSIKPIVQNSKQATYTTLLKKEHGKIDWSLDSEELINHYKAMTPWPGAFTCFDDNYLKILSMSLGDEKANGKPGSILSVNKDYFVVNCGNGSVAIDKIQLSGKKVMNFRDFSNGSDIINKNTVFEF
ncbi:MAG: methionyl-tRNA formyltransferase [Candidatus Muirbacterium halophilum]|nr:methionyl-tRNA formyltransferase [Candidatus Muirbacterium halophilum]MCK9475408.1 methionyl-tRNA formyltransferase [Candidatus Muirbacterium halophilum]